MAEMGRELMFRAAYSSSFIELCWLSTLYLEFEMRMFLLSAFGFSTWSRLYSPITMSCFVERLAF